METINPVCPSPDEVGDFIKGIVEKATPALKEVRTPMSYKVERYSELVALAAQLSFNNPDCLLLYRGQSDRHLNEKDELSFLPTIYRAPKNGKLTDEILHQRFKKLDEMTEKIAALDKFQKLLKGIPRPRQIMIIQGILQHYHKDLGDKVDGTPFLDLTQALRVAYSFAGMPEKDGEIVKKTKDGMVYVYVFGLPYPQNFIDEKDGITMIRLFSICPAIALRPSFQEGYLIKIPDTRSCEEISRCDFNQRLIAEIAIPKDKIENENYFHRIPNISLDSITPKLDEILKNIKDILEK